MKYCATRTPQQTGERPTGVELGPARIIPERLLQLQ